MRTRHKINRLIKKASGMRIVGGKGFTVDKLDHQIARLVVKHRRRYARRMGGTTSAKFIKPHDLMHRDIIADAHNHFAQIILDYKIDIGDATALMGNLGHPLPNWQRQGHFQWCDRPPPLILAMVPIVLGLVKPKELGCGNLSETGQ